LGRYFLWGKDQRRNGTRYAGAMTNAAIYYQHEAFDTRSPKLMGRQAAGEGFLAGFARHAGVERLLAYARTRREFDEFRRQVGSGRECAWIPHGDAQGRAAA